MRILLTLMILISLTNSWGHGGEDHSEVKIKIEKPTSDEQLQKKYVKINKEYIKKVKPLFKRSCFDCHGNTTEFPWYYKLPGAKQLIDHDIVESKRHLDFSNDFPFKSHEEPLKDFYAIEQSIKSTSMPPFRYRILHRNSVLSKEEIEQVMSWIKSSREKLE